MRITELLHMASVPGTALSDEQQALEMGAASNGAARQTMSDRCWHTDAGTQMQAVQPNSTSMPHVACGVSAKDSAVWATRTPAFATLYHARILPDVAETMTQSSMLRVPSKHAQVLARKMSDAAQVTPQPLNNRTQGHTRCNALRHRLTAVVQT